LKIIIIGRRRRFRDSDVSHEGIVGGSHQVFVIIFPKRKEDRVDDVDADYD
jgi:hypothetical protein